jgi:hypothetical protein
MATKEELMKPVKTPTIEGGKSFNEAMGIQAPYLEKQSQLQSGISAAEGNILRGQQAQKEVQAVGEEAAQKGYAAAEKGAMQQYQQKLEAEPLPAFIPTKDTAQDIAGLFSLIGVIGMIAGRSNAQQAMGAMNGMLEGHRKGRADLYKQQASEFDKNFKAMMQKHAEFRKEMEDAVKLAATDKEAGIAAAKLAAVRSGSSIINAQIDKGDLMGAYKNVDESKKATENAYKVYTAEKRHAEDMAQKERHQREMMASREKVAGLRQLGGARSATNERYANTVFRSSNEVLRSLELIEQIGLTTGGGALGGVVGKGSIPSEVQRYIGQAMTDEQQKNYNTAMSGLALEMAYVLNGGYKPDASTVSKIETLLSVGPNDTAGTAAYKFADANAKLKAAIETSPTYTEDQKKTKDMLMQKVERYATPEVVYERVYGVPERREPTVRSGQYPKPQTQAEFDALAPGAEYIDPDDGKLYKKRAK